LNKLINWPLHKNYIFLLVFYIVIIAGCKKDPSSIGVNVQPPGDFTKTFFTDTITLTAFTVKDDSITSDERTLNLLGSYIDPIFGLSTASFLTQFRAPSTPLFDTSFHADSLVLYLKYNSYYGNIFTPQNIVVYELTSPIYIEDTIYSNKNVSQFYNNSIEIANKTFIPNPNDDSLAIKLSYSLANKIFKTQGANFSDNFKGLYIKATDVSSGGAILYFDLLSSKTKLTLYYKNSTETLNYSFVVNSSCARFNLFNHDYTNAVFNSHLNDTINEDNVVYIQSMAGVKVKVKFPYIQNLKTLLGTIAINKAELIINDVSDEFSDVSIYTLPAKLLALMPADSGRYNFLPDYNVSTSYFDGNYYSTDKLYKFNITRYIQKLIDNEYKNKIPGIYLFTSENRISARRAVLTSGKNSKPMKLLITYTKL